jgi:hypothetical protein
MWPPHLPTIQNQVSIELDLESVTPNPNLGLSAGVLTNSLRAQREPNPLLLIT